MRWQIELTLKFSVENFNIYANVYNIYNGKLTLKVFFRDWFTQKGSCVRQNFQRRGQRQKMARATSKYVKLTLKFSFQWTTSTSTQTPAWGSWLKPKSWR